MAIAAAKSKASEFALMNQCVSHGAFFLKRAALG